MQLMSAIRFPGLRWLRFVALLAAWLVPQSTAYPLTQSERDESPAESQEFVRTSRETHIAPSRTVPEPLSVVFPNGKPEPSRRISKATSGHFLANGLRAPLRC